MKSLAEKNFYFISLPGRDRAGWLSYPVILGSLTMSFHLVRFMGNFMFYHGAAHQVASIWKISAERDLKIKILQLFSCRLHSYRQQTMDRRISLLITAITQVYLLLPVNEH
jgi:hypothetical protein